MNREIEQAILTEGYRFCRVQPENIGVFYKYYQQGFHVVMMISLEDTQALTVEQHQVMQERVMDLFYHPQGISRGISGDLKMHWRIAEPNQKVPEVQIQVFL